MTAGRQVFAPPREHPIFGFTECAVRDCPGLAAQAGDMCGPCARRWRGVQPARMALEEFVATPRLRIVQRRKREVLCRVCCVAGFERPASGPLGLCLLCAKSFRRSLVPSVDDWIHGGQHRKSRRAPRAPARPRATYGRCERCGRRASHPRPLSCGPCQLTWRRLASPAGIAGNGSIRSRSPPANAFSTSRRCPSVSVSSFSSACRMRCTVSGSSMRGAT